MTETEVQKIANKNRLSVSRIAEWAKDYVVQRSEEEFCGDYGQCIMAMAKECGELALIKTNFLSENTNKSEVENETDTGKKKIKFGNGKEVVIGGRK